MSFYKTILLSVELVFVDFACCMDCFSERIVLCVDSEHHTKVQHTFFSSFFLAEINESTFFKESLGKIKKYETGRNLLKRLGVLFSVCSSLKQEDIKLIVTFSSDPSCFGGRFFYSSVYKRNACFYLNGTKVDEEKRDLLSVSINLNLISNTLYHEELGLCTMVPGISRVIELESDDLSLCLIKDYADPYWMLIAHELIHMEHFLTQELVKICSVSVFTEVLPQGLNEEFASESKKRVLEKLDALCLAFQQNEDYSLVEPIAVMCKCKEYYSIETLKEMHHELCCKRRYEDNKVITPQKALEFLSSSGAIADPLPPLPELASRTERVSHVWDFLEERETVIGAENSELHLRLEANLPIRYIYQVRGKCFAEGFDTVLQIINAADTSLTKQGLREFINNDVHARHFDTRKFRLIIDEELLPDTLFTHFGFDKVPTTALLEVKDVGKKRIMPELLVKTLLIPRIIGAYERDNLNLAVSDLCVEGKLGTIRREIKSILSDNMAIISKVEEHIKNSLESYDKEIIRGLIDLLRNFAVVERSEGAK